MVIPVIDVFAGPGGLNEGFQARRADGSPSPFRTKASIEMDPVACSTLRLRAAVLESRGLDGRLSPAYVDFLTGALDWSGLMADREFGQTYEAVEHEVSQFELAESSRAASDEIIRSALGTAADGSEPWVLVGGPPCQAYSLAGRSRRANDETFADDHKHTLYKEYLHIIRTFRPAVFVMENVKGMLSSKHEGGRIFDAIRRDLMEPAEDLSYELRSFVVAGNDVSPQDYVIRSEEYGVPQARHRVILLGVRVGEGLSEPRALRPSPTVTVGDTIGELPAIRSKVSRTDDVGVWGEALVAAYRHAQESGGAVPAVAFGEIAVPPVGTTRMKRSATTPDTDLERWLDAAGVPVWVQHESRGHMAKDLERYGYLAWMGRQGLKPKVTDLPEGLVPEHKNVAAGKAAPFTDRFRVQLASRPANTIVSHIAKDGHYFIHPDPLQMRSLSVREAARLQTFPDDYFFMGNRTQQYHQVGNAVPPYLARQLSEVVAEVLGV